MGQFPKYEDRLHDGEQKLCVHVTSTSLEVTASLKLNTDSIVILGK